MKKLFQKKFKVRVNYFAEDKYTVDWANYRFFPIWYSLCFWFEQTLTGGTECWSTNLFQIKDAEKLANTLKSRADIRRYYEPEENKEKDFYKRQNEY
jgi:hypothetical protein